VSRSKNDGQRDNKEFWGRRPCKLKYKDAGPETKKLTHRAERNQGKQEVRRDGS
jgi:hypothetical protein